MPNFLKPYGAAVAAVCLSVAILAVSWEIHHLRASLQRCKAANADLARANKDFSEVLERQNRAVAALQETAQAKRNEAEKAFAVARDDGRKHAFKAARLHAQKATGDDCADIKELLNDYFK